MFRVPITTETEQQKAQRPLYNKTNAFWTSKSVQDLVDELPETERGAMLDKVKEIKKLYNGLSERYQDTKGGAGIPLA